MILSNSVAVITGAASGVGRALAVRLANEKIAGVGIADVNERGLLETAAMVEKLGVPVSAHVIDVARLDEVERLAGEVLQKHGRVTHLINNAGVGLIGTFDQISLDDFEWLMRINFWGAVYGCKTFLPTLLSQERAHIVNVSSAYSFIAPPEQTAYCASKFAVRAFTESLRHELDGTNVRVSCVHPGAIKTNIARNARLGERAPDAYRAQSATLFQRFAHTSAETAADVIVRGIRSQKPRILIGKDSYGIDIISRLFPTRYLRVIEALVGRHRLDSSRRI